MAQGASLVLGFLLWAFAARTLGVDAFGQTQLGIAVGTYLALLVSVGTNVLGISELHAQSRARSYVFRVQTIRIAHATVIIVALAAAAIVLPRSVPAVIALCAVSVVVRELWPEWVDVALGASRRVVGVRSAYFLVVLPSVALLVHSPVDRILFCGILVAAALLVAAPAWYFTTAGLRRWDLARPQTVRSPRRSWVSVWGSTLRRSFPLGAAGALGQLVANADILLLGVLATDEAVAQYGAACRILFAVQGVGVAVRLASLKATAEPGPDREQYEWDLFTVTLLLAAVMASVCALVAPYLVPLTFGSAYSDSVSLLRILAWSWPLDFASAILLNALIVRGERRRYVTAMSLAAVSNVVANLLLIPRFGAAGAAVVTVASLALLLGYLLLRPVSRVHRHGGATTLGLGGVLTAGFLGSVLANSGASLAGAVCLAVSAAGAGALLAKLYGSRIRSLVSLSWL
jgi:O-antigen/teichoic acid export membrane protein